MILNSDPKLLYHFLNLCQGNWHRTVYVTCNDCPTAACPMRDFLMLPDAQGKPILLPVQDAAILFSERPDPSECLCTLSFAQFSGMYDAYLGTLPSTEDHTCIAVKLKRILTDTLYDW